jgi:hypothetical protein
VSVDVSAPERSLIAVVAGLVSVLLIPSAGNARSPAQTLAAILAAGKAQRSVHYVSDSMRGIALLHIDCDATRTTGIQRITYEKNGVTGYITIRVVAHTAYVRGDSFTLQNYIGLKQSAAEKFAAQWIRAPQTDRAYASIATGVTLPSLIDGLRITGLLTLVPTSAIGSQRVIGVSGTIGQPPIGAAVYARADGTLLPVGEIVHSGLLVGMFSKWNEPVRVQVPARAVAIATARLG